MNRTLRIHAFLTTTTPLHISSGVQGSFDFENGRASYKSGPGLTPCMLVQTLGIANDDSEFGSVQVPVIMANNIMGRLRRRAAAEVLGVIERKGERVKTGTYSALMCGAVSGNPDSEEPTFEEYRAARAHAYLGLFGGGPKLYRRHVHGFNAVPYTSGSRPMFARCKHPNFDEAVHAVRAGQEHHLTRAVLQNRNDDLRELVNLSLASKTIENFTDEIVARQSAIIDTQKQKGAEKEKGARVTTRSFTSFQYVIPNVVFPLCWELREVTDAQLGLFLLALDAFAHSEELGGFGRNGFGRFTLTDVAVTDVDDALLADGLFQNNRLNRSQPEVSEALAAWTAESEAFTGSGLNDLFAAQTKA